MTETGSLQSISRRSFLKLATASAAGTAFTSLMSSYGMAAALACEASFTTLSLSALPWVTDSELRGARLRWTLPMFAEDGTFGRCLPETISVFRGVTPDRLQKYLTIDPSKGTSPTLFYPEEMWSATLQQVSENPTIFKPSWKNSGGPAPTTIEAVAFDYKGKGEAVAEICDIEGRVLAAFPLVEGDRFYFQGAPIGFVRFLHSFPVSLASCSGLLAFRSPDIGLGDKIADIGCRRALAEPAKFEDVRRRLLGSASTGQVVTTSPYRNRAFTEEDWEKLVKSASEISGESCEAQPKISMTPDKISYREVDFFLLGASARWEYSVIAGLGYRDGPQPTKCSFDVATAGLELNAAPVEDTYYTIKALYADGSEEISNHVFLQVGDAKELATPNYIYYRSPRAQHTGEASIGSTSRQRELGSPMPADRNEIQCQTELVWSHAGDGHATGVYLEESWRSGGNSTDEEIMAFASRFGVLDREGSCTRRHAGDLETILRTSARTYDGWDRLSEGVAIQDCRFYPLGLQRPPPIGEALILKDFGDRANVAIDVLSGKNLVGLDPWQFDLISRAIFPAGGSIFLQLFRRLQQPQEMLVTIKSVPTNNSGGSDSVILGVSFSDAEAALYRGGSVIQGPVTAVVDRVVGDQCFLIQPGRTEAEIPPLNCPVALDVNGQAATVVQPGLATLRGNLYHPDNWQSVPEQKGGRVTLSGDYSPPERHTVLDILLGEIELPTTEAFTWRLEGELRGQTLVGPFCEAGIAPRYPMVPPMPKPFEIVALGFDYYQRLALEITLIEPDLELRDGDLFEVHWTLRADSDLQNIGTFESRATPGFLGPQTPFERAKIFEVIDVTPPTLFDMECEIGVRRVTKAGITGSFKVESLLLRAE